MKLITIIDFFFSFCDWNGPGLQRWQHPCGGTWVHPWQSNWILSSHPWPHPHSGARGGPTLGVGDGGAWHTSGAQPPPTPMRGFRTTFERHPIVQSSTPLNIFRTYCFGNTSFCVLGSQKGLNCTQHQKGTECDEYACATKNRSHLSSSTVRLVLVRRNRERSLVVCFIVSAY